MSASPQKRASSKPGPLLARTDHAGPRLFKGRCSLPYRGAEKDLLGPSQGQRESCSKPGALGLGSQRYNPLRWPGSAEAEEDLSDVLQARRCCDRMEIPTSAKPFMTFFTISVNGFSPSDASDMDTSGLLLLTNDTGFGERLTNPAFKVPKTYQLKIDFHPSAEQFQMLEQGLLLKNGERTLPAKARLLRQTERHSFLELVIIEGKNRQVRRMIEALGGRILKLVRDQDRQSRPWQVAKWALSTPGSL